MENDFNTEGINNKSDALLEIVKGLKAKNLIDGVGFQCHFIIGETPPDLQANLQRFVDAGVEVAITELDLRTTLPVTQADVIQQVKDYAFVVNACKSISRCVGVVSVMFLTRDLYLLLNVLLHRRHGVLLISTPGSQAHSRGKALVYSGMVSAQRVKNLPCH